MQSKLTIALVATILLLTSCTGVMPKSEVSECPRYALTPMLDGQLTSMGVGSKNSTLLVPAVVGDPNSSSQVMLDFYGATTKPFGVWMQSEDGVWKLLKNRGNFIEGIPNRGSLKLMSLYGDPRLCAPNSPTSLPNEFRPADLKKQGQWPN